MRQGVRGDDVEAKSQRVRFDACGSPDFDHDPGHRTHAFLASAPDNEVDDALAQRQLVHRCSQPASHPGGNLTTWTQTDDRARIALAGGPNPRPTLRSNGSISGMRVPDLTDGGDKGVHIDAGVELAEADSHRSFGKSPDGLVRCRGAMQPGTHGNPE